MNPLIFVEILEYGSKQAFFGFGGLFAGVVIETGLAEVSFSGFAGVFALGIVVSF